MTPLATSEHIDGVCVPSRYFLLLCSFIQARFLKKAPLVLYHVSIFMLLGGCKFRMNI